MTAREAGAVTDITGEPDEEIDDDRLYTAEYTIPSLPIGCWICGIPGRATKPCDTCNRETCNNCEREEKCASCISVLLSRVKDEKPVDPRVDEDPQHKAELDAAIAEVIRDAADAALHPVGDTYERAAVP